MDVMMHFAIVDGHRREPGPGLRGECQFDGHPMVAKCGQLRKWHWAHLGAYACDHWWKNKTEWHLNWQRQFPNDLQEKMAYDKDGEKHIADVKTAHGWVLEFQHSYLDIEERRARESFYGKLIWIVDVTASTKSKGRFIKVLEKGFRVCTSPPIKKILFPEDCALLRKWAGCMAPVFFDFGERKASDKPRLGCLLPLGPDGGTYIVGFSRTEFLNLLGNRDSKLDIDDFAEKIKTLHKIIADRLTDRTNLLAIRHLIHDRPARLRDWVRQENGEFRKRA